MTVKEMMRSLAQFDPDAVVLVATDAEGNGYHEPYDIVKAHYSYDGQYREFEVKHPDDAEPDDLIGVVIWP